MDGKRDLSIGGLMGDSMPSPAPTPKRTLHPALKQRAAAVKASHAALSKQPGFAKLQPRERIRRTSAHASKAMKGGY